MYKFVSKKAKMQAKGQIQTKKTRTSRAIRSRSAVEKSLSRGMHRGRQTVGLNNLNFKP